MLRTARHGDAYHSDAIRDQVGRLISAKDAARLFPPSRGGRPVAVGTVMRWGLKGCPAKAPGRKGERIYLWMVRGPGQWMTSADAVARFLEALTADRLGQSAPAPAAPRTTARRAREIARAERELAEAGF